MQKDLNETTSTPKYWLSLEQWRNDDDFKELAQREFLASPLAEDNQTPAGGWARREFLKLMGASLALSTFGCIRRPVEKIVPYAKRPKEIIPGLPNYYASTFVDGYNVVGTVVRTREGRPIKIEGNEFYPGSGEALSARGQAQILSLYDPDRLTAPIQNLVNAKRTNKDTVSTTWAKAIGNLKISLTEGGTYVLSSSNPSPTSRSIIEKFVAQGKGQYFEYDALDKSTLKKSQQNVTGVSVMPSYDFESADVVVGIDADYLGTGVDATSNQRAFAKRRDPNGSMNYAVQFESMLSLTGSNADERFAIKPSDQLALVLRLAEVLCSMTGTSFPTAWREIYGSFSEEIKALPITPEKLNKIADRLVKAKGKSLVVSGAEASMTANQSAVYDVINFINGMLGNDGKTVQYGNSITSVRGSIEDVKELVELMNQGKVKTLVIHNSNPLYTLPESFGFRSALAKVKTVYYTGDRVDETGLGSDYIIPDHHALEKWMDVEFVSGVLSLSQPTIQPLYDTKAFEDVLLQAMGSTQTWYEAVKSSTLSKIGGSEKAWTQFLQKGVNGTVSNSAKSSRSYKGNNLKISLDEAADFELVLYTTIGIKDGTLSNVSWLQEFPDPITKICWDNYLCVSTGTALKNGLKEGDVVSLTTSNATVEVPVHIQPGLNDKVIALALGYGRQGGGKVSTDVDVNAYQFAVVEKDQIVYSGINAKFSKTGKHIPLANVQGHHSMEGRQIVVEATLKDVLENPQAGQHKHKVFSLWSEHKYKGHKWGMAVDLSKCNGCGACMIACQAENNIPVVGKRHVLNGREMHWLRIDRYYTGTPEAPDVVFQPVMCMHCDNAPCETVCPVLATVHSDEGTNDMVYNRCVGTRYCANNCPYKVRRFNWFNYSKVSSPLKMVLNPEVTVRSRGVMEKCTFCVQRVKAKKTEAKLADRKLQDQEIKTACQQTCAAEALVFGDLNDPSSEVSKMQRSLRSYGLLEELAVMPAVKYMSKVRNVAKLKSHGGDDHGDSHQSKKGGHH
jgi:MoCo/4Fe-4S cofactor protein with predicted Tat translocation signal